MQEGLSTSDFNFGSTLIQNFPRPMTSTDSKNVNHRQADKWGDIVRERELR